MPLRNIIFDLGGIFIDIDYNKTRNAFTALGVKDFDQWYQQSYANPLFSRLETGDISEEEFSKEIITQGALQCEAPQVVAAWNALLGSFRPKAIEFIETLKPGYRLFLLSNTNAIHHRAFTAAFEEQFHQSFDTHFEQAWYSHSVGCRKPNPSCYTHVLNLAGLKADETLFIDDTPVNLEGAKEAGLHTFWLQPGKQLEEELPAYLQQH